MAVASPWYRKFSFASRPTNQNCLSIAEARNAIKAKFRSYRQLLDKKELELLSELDTIEETNKSELSHVQYDLKKLRVAITTLGESLGTNTLKAFLEQQKSVWNSEIKGFERSERLLSHLRLKYSDFNLSVENIIEIVPYRTKAKFRSDLEPLLELELKVGDEWFLVSDGWFSQFATSINLYNPQYDDSWRFPEGIPIDHYGIYANGQIINESACKKLHSKAWNMLLGFHNLSFGSPPIKRLPFLNPLNKEVTLPIVPIPHKCHIGHKSGDNDFNIQFDMTCFPTDTYAEVLDRITNFSKLMTTHTPQFFSFDSSDFTVSYSSCKYKVNKTKLPVPVQHARPSDIPFLSTSWGSGVRNPRFNAPQGTPFFQPLGACVPIDFSPFPLSKIGLFEKTLVLLIPDSTGTKNMQLVTQQ